MPRIALLVMPLAVLSAAEPDDREEAMYGEPAFMPSVYVNGVQSVPQAPLTWFDHHLELHPKVSAGGGYDSNPQAIDGGEGSADISFGGGLDGVLAYDRTNRLELLSQAYRQHFTTAALDVDVSDFDVRLEAVHDADDWNLRVGGFARRVNDSDTETGETVPRILAGGVGYFSQQRIRWGIESAVRFEETRYLAGTTDDRDNRAASVSLEVSYRTTRTVTPMMLVEVTGRKYTQSGYFNDAQGYWVGLGASWQPAPKTALAAAVGPAARRYGDAYQRDPAYDDANVRLLRGWLRGSWNWAANSQLALRLSNELEEAVTSNASAQVRGEVRQSTYVSQVLRIAVYAGFERSANTAALPGIEPDRRVTRLVGLDLQRDMGAGLTVQWRSWYALSDAVYGESYTRGSSQVQVAWTF
jgi:hypothetical protein